jgi:hypothetical protein
MELRLHAALHQDEPAIDHIIAWGSVPLTGEIPIVPGGDPLAKLLNGDVDAQQLLSAGLSNELSFP